ncbi:MAG: zinc ribbon domain-containing protein [Oscillospiraceae bacterium]|nr:zinc ribbon domain-containing protein [Oscillospiraceae bacterium]
MHKQRLILAIVSVLGILATFLPWATNIPFLGSVNGIAGDASDGWFTLILFAVALIISLIGNRTEAMVSKIKFVAVGAGLINAIIAIWNISQVNDLRSAFGGFGISVGFGLYLLVIAGIGVAVIPFFTKLFDKAPQGNQGGGASAFCPNCGSSMTAGSDFCGNCGHKT